MLKPELPLTLKNIPTLYKNFISMLKQGISIDLDLKEVNEIDSAGVALIIELKQLAKNKNYHFTINNPSQSVLRLCSLYNVNF